MRKRQLFVGLLIALVTAVVIYFYFGTRIIRVWEQREFPRQKRAVTDLQTLAFALRHAAEKGNLQYPVHSDVIGTKNVPAFRSSTPRVWPVNGQQHISAVATQLAPYFTSREEVPMRDPWGHAYVYAVSRDARHYVLLSVGSDGRLDGPRIAFIWDSKESWRDIVVVDGEFVSYPYGISVANP